MAKTGDWKTKFNSSGMGVNRMTSFPSEACTSGCTHINMMHRRHQRKTTLSIKLFIRLNVQHWWRMMIFAMNKPKECLLQCVAWWLT